MIRNTKSPLSAPPSQLEHVDAAESGSTAPLPPFNGDRTPTKSVMAHNSSDNENAENVHENAPNVDLATPQYRKRKNYRDLTVSGRAHKRKRAIKLLQTEEKMHDSEDLKLLLRDALR